MRWANGLPMLLVLLSACGDSGNSSSPVVASTTSSPTPTPNPTTSGTTPGVVLPSPEAVFLAATMDVTTTGGTAETNGVITGGMTANRITTFDTPNFSASYSSANGFRLGDAIIYTTFAPSQLTSDTTTTNGNGTVVYVNRTSAADNYLALYQASSYVSSYRGSGAVTARYGGIGGWQHTYVNGSTRQTRLNYFAYGSPTSIAAMPRSGVVRYEILNAGNYATDTDLWFLQEESGAYLTVDFGAGTITGSISLSGQNFYKSVVGGIGSIPVKASFTGNSALASFTNGNLQQSGVPGNYRVLFIGPAANELIITYVAMDGSEAVVGATIGIINPNAQP